MGYTVAQLLDLGQTTRDKVQKQKWSQLSSTLTDLVGVKQLWKRRQMSIQGGTNFTYKVAVGHGENFTMTELYENDNLTRADKLKTVTVPWKFFTNGWYIDTREGLINSGSDEEVIDRYDFEKTQCDIATVEGLEPKFWGKPTSTTSLDFWGIPFWVHQTNSTATGAFQGGHPSGFSDVGGLSATTYTRWNNWTATYTDVSKADLISKWRRAMYNIQFKAPVSFKDAVGDGKPSKYGWYTNTDTILELEEVLENQNDNLGADVDRYGGQTMFRKVPVTHVPYLDNDTADPIYGIFWPSFHLFAQKGYFMKRSEPRQQANNHNVIEGFVDGMANIACTDRSRNCVLYKA